VFGRTGTRKERNSRRGVTCGRKLLANFGIAGEGDFFRSITDVLNGKKSIRNETFFAEKITDF
jgi:hypothetical protein